MNELQAPDSRKGSAIALVLNRVSPDNQDAGLPAFVNIKSPSRASRPTKSILLRTQLDVNYRHTDRKQMHLSFPTAPGLRRMKSKAGPGWLRSWRLASGGVTSVPSFDRLTETRLDFADYSHRPLVRQGRLCEAISALGNAIGS